MAQQYWFTTKQGNWTPNDGYNTVFVEIVRLIRSWYSLQKISPGVERGSGKWIRCDFQAGTVFVTIDKFTWNTTISDGGILSPLLLLDYRLGRKPGSEIFSQETMEVRFPAAYPIHRPMTRIAKPRFYNLSISYEHHINPSGGWMCLAVEGNWNARRDTIITALNWAWEWILFHHTQFGW